MIFARFTADGKDRFGVVSGSRINEIAPHYFGEFRRTGSVFALSCVRLLAPCRPGKIIALGLNYRDHARELDMALPKQPLLFLKASSAVIGPGDAVICPPDSRQVEYEGELAVVIGRRARHVSARSARAHILGYTCFNDVTARDLQKTDGQWSRAKSFDTFAPLGPWIVSGIDPSGLRVETRVNGRRRQSSSTAEMIFAIPFIVSYVSRIMTLEPGDVIATGTPPGVGRIASGDTVSVRISGIGTLVNIVR